MKNPKKQAENQHHGIIRELGESTKKGFGVFFCGATSTIIYASIIWVILYIILSFV